MRLERCWNSSSCDWKKQQQSVQSGDSHLDHSHLWTHKMEKTSCIKEPVCVCAYTCLCAAGCVCVQRWGFPRAANEGNTAFIECVALGRHPPGTDKHRRPRKDGTTMERTTWPERRRREQKTQMHRQTLAWFPLEYILCKFQHTELQRLNGRGRNLEKMLYQYCKKGFFAQTWCENRFAVRGNVGAAVMETHLLNWKMEEERLEKCFPHNSQKFSLDWDLNDFC